MEWELSGNPGQLPPDRSPIKDVHMPPILSQLLTGRDNQTHDIARWLAAASFAVGLGLTIYVTIRGQPFALQDFGAGIGILFVAVGAAIKLKEGSEP